MLDILNMTPQQASANVVSKTFHVCIACCAGPASSFLVISDPAAAKHVLRASDNPRNPIYDKGLVAEVGFTPI